MCSEPLFTSQSSFKNQPFTQPHDKKERKQHINHVELLKLLFEYDKVTPFVLPFTTAWPRATLNLSGCRHLYILERGTKSHREHLEWQILSQRKEKIRKRKQCAIYVYVIVFKTISCSAPFFNIIPSLDSWELL